jgi:hypothetical protein
VALLDLRILLPANPSAVRAELDEHPGLKRERAGELG